MFLKVRKGDGAAERKTAPVSLFSGKNASKRKKFDKIAKKSEKAPAKDLIFLAFCIRMNYGKKCKARRSR